MPYIPATWKQIKIDRSLRIHHNMRPTVRPGIHGCSPQTTPTTHLYSSCLPSDPIMNLNTTARLERYCDIGTGRGPFGFATGGLSIDELGSNLGAAREPLSLLSSSWRALT